MLKLFNRTSSIFGFSSQSTTAKVLISNSNSIYFNLAFEEYLFESSINLLTQNISPAQLFFFIETAPPLLSAGTKIHGNNAEMNWWKIRV